MDSHDIPEWQARHRERMRRRLRSLVSRTPNRLNYGRRIGLAMLRPAPPP